MRSTNSQLAIFVGFCSNRQVSRETLELILRHPRTPQLVHQENNLSVRVISEPRAVAAAAAAAAAACSERRIRQGGGGDDKKDKERVIRVLVIPLLALLLLLEHPVPTLVLLLPAVREG
jgi:hypothetical protein